MIYKLNFYSLNYSYPIISLIGHKEAIYGIQYNLTNNNDNKFLISCSCDSTSK